MPDKLSTADFSKVAEYIKEELSRRQSGRKGLEQKWGEVDRQIAMEPKPREVKSGEELDWYPQMEEPEQYNALEVIMADLRAMLFPRGADWFEPLANLSDKYLKRWETTRRTRPLIGEIPDNDQKDTALDQETADALVKATIDYFHRQYDFRGKINLPLCEMLKYGTGVARVREVDFSRFHHEFRGVRKESLIGPSLAPTTIKNTYPDPAAHFVLHEGHMTQPTILSVGHPLLDDMKRAAKAGGRDKGWLTGVMSRMEPLKNRDARGHVERIEAEGDLIVPKSQGSIFLPNVLVTVVIGGNGARVVRFRTNPIPWRSYVFFDYLKDKVDSPYGGSPLLKGASIQDASAFMLNDLLASSRLNVVPPVVWDRQDTQLAAEGGPAIYPNAQYASDNPDAIKPMVMSDPSVLMTVYAGIASKYENLLAVNDPRRGGGVKSHTGTGGNLADIERSVARTQDVADDVANGPLTTILNMEYDIIKQSFNQTRPVPIDSAGIEGWVRLNKTDLADEVIFRVFGASGVAERQQDNANFFTAAQFTMQAAGLAAQLQQPVDIDMTAIITEAWLRSGVNNAAKFVRRANATPPGPPVAPELSEAGGGAGNEEDALAALEGLGGQLDL